MSDTPPDRLAIDSRSKFHDPDLLARGIGIRLNGNEKTMVEEYCISEGWVKVAAGKSRDRKGNPLMLTLKGTVEAWFKDAPAEAEAETAAAVDTGAEDKAAG